jgi:hypothetical protein
MIGSDAGSRRAVPFTSVCGAMRAGIRATHINRKLFFIGSAPPPVCEIASPRCPEGNRHRRLRGDRCNKIAALIVD